MVAPFAQGWPADAGCHAHGAEGGPAAYERQSPEPHLGTVHGSSIDPTTDKTQFETKACPGWDSNPHCAVFEAAPCCLVGVPGHERLATEPDGARMTIYRFTVRSWA